MVRRPLTLEPIGRSPTVLIGRVIGGRVGQNITEDTSEPGPLLTGPARFVVHLFFVLLSHLWA